MMMLLNLLLALLAATASGSSTDPVPPQTQAQCDKNAIQTEFNNCLKDIFGSKGKKSKETCAAIREKCKPAITDVEDKKFVRDAARTALSKCVLDGGARSDCQEQFQTATGGVVDSVREKLEEDRGTKDAVADFMKQCTESEDPSKDCKADFKTKMETLRGGSIPETELANTLVEAGASAAGEQMKACKATATTPDERKACFGGAAAKEAFAKASGRNVNDIKDVDLKMAATRQGVKDVKDTLKACIELAASDDTAKKECFKCSDLKESIASSGSADASTLKCSRVSDAITKGARADMLTIIEGCDKTTTTGKAECLEVMKTLKADSIAGKTAAQVSELDLTYDTLQATKTNLADKMVACMENAGADKAACRATLAKDEIKRGDLNGREPSKGKVEEMLRGAAKVKASTVMKDCEEDRAACTAIAKDKMGKALGKSAGQVSTKDVEVYIRQGALEDMKDSALACSRAKKADASATCDDLLTKYEGSTKKSRSSNAKKAQQEKSRLMVDTFAALEMSVLAVCMDKPSNEVETCFQNFKQENDEVASQILGGEGSQATTVVLDARKKAAKAKATMSYLGERHAACMQAATTPDEKKTCKDDMADKMTLAGVSQKQTAVLKGFRAQQLTEAVTVCSTTDRMACMESAKQDMVANGMKERKFDMVKRVGEVKSAAEVYATCKQGGGTADDCAALAKDEFILVSGADDATWTKMLAGITKVATAIEIGEEVVMKEKMQLLISAITDGTSCDDDVLSSLLTLVQDEAKENIVTPSISGTKLGECRMVNGKAEYSSLVGIAGFSETEAETAGDTLNTGVQGGSVRRLAAFLEEMRRLATVTTAYTAKDTEVCGAADATCGQADAALRDCSNHPTDPGCPSATTSGTTFGTTSGTTSASTSVTGSAHGRQGSSIGALVTLAVSAFALV